MKKKKAPKRKYKKKEGLGTNLNPTHKEDFDKVLEMLVPKVKPKGIKSDKMLED